MHALTEKVLVTGATGFIGRHVVKRLRSEGLIVHGLSRRGGIVEDVLVAAVDLTDAAQVREWQQGKEFDAIIHLAAAIPAQVTDPAARDCFNTNVYAMANVLTLANQCHIVYTSSSSVYGAVFQTDVPLTEERRPEPDNFYATSKHVGELAMQKRGLSHTTLRVSSPYGPGNFRPTVINAFLRAALESRDLVLYGSGFRMQDFTYISDVVEAIWLALVKRTVGTFNIASGTSVSMRQLAERVLEALSSSGSKVVYSGRPDPQENYRVAFSIEKARQQLGWSPQVSLVRGLKLAAEVLQC